MRIYIAAHMWIDDKVLDKAFVSKDKAEEFAKLRKADYRFDSEGFVEEVEFEGEEQPMNPDCNPLRFEHGCLGKERYPSEEAVLAALRFARKRHAVREVLIRNAGSLIPYQCPFCEAGETAHWHFGH